jgi:hypothetical protein
MVVGRSIRLTSHSCTLSSSSSSSSSSLPKHTDTLSPDSVMKVALLAGTVLRANECVKATTRRTPQVRTTLRSCNPSPTRIQTSNTHCRLPPVKRTPTSFIVLLLYRVALPLLRPSLTTDTPQTQYSLRYAQTRPAEWMSLAHHTMNIPIEHFHRLTSP